PRGTANRHAGAQVEASLVTGAEEDALVRSRNHRAREVRALLAERDEVLLPDADEQTRIVIAGIVEDQSAADREVVDRGDAARRQGIAAFSKPVLDRNPELAGREGAADQHHELHEVTALDVLVLRPVDREVVPPRRLRVERRAIGRGGDL